MGGSRMVGWMASAAAVAVLGVAVSAQAPTSLTEAAAAAQQALVARHGEAERARIVRGVSQVAAAWRGEDGDAAAFRQFVEADFLPAGPALDQTFDRLEAALEGVEGHFNAMGRDLRRGLDLEIGPGLPIDDRLGAWDPASHLTDDLFSTRVAFVVLLNFPRSTLDRAVEGGPVVDPTTVGRRAADRPLRAARAGRGAGAPRRRGRAPPRATSTATTCARITCWPRTGGACSGPSCA